MRMGALDRYIEKFSCQHVRCSIEAPLTTKYYICLIDKCINISHEKCFNCIKFIHFKYKFIYCTQKYKKKKIL